MSNLDDERTQIPTAELTNPTGRLTRVRLSGDGPPVFVDHTFEALEFFFEDESTPALQIVSALDWRQLHSRYVITQPEILATDVRRGWLPVGGVYPDWVLIGAGRTPQFELPECGKNPLLHIHAHDTFLTATACKGASASVQLAEVDRLPAGGLYSEAL